MNEKQLNNLKREISRRVEQLDLEIVVLFGSVAKNEDSPDSDIDLYVVTRDMEIPKTWSEKNQIYLKVSRCLRDLRKQYPIDLIVHTKAMYTKFLEGGSVLASEIFGSGMVIV